MVKEPRSKHLLATLHWFLISDLFCIRSSFKQCVSIPPNNSYLNCWRSEKESCCTIYNWKMTCLDFSCLPLSKSILMLFLIPHSTLWLTVLPSPFLYHMSSKAEGFTGTEMSNVFSVVCVLSGCDLGDLTGKAYVLAGF